MKQQLKLAGLAVLFGFVSHAAVAQDKIKIGVIVTLSGPAAVLGQQARDGFALAVKDLGGKMGGRDVEVVVVDDELKPDGAVDQGQGPARTRQGRFRGGADLLQHPAGDPQAGDGQQDLPDQPECRPVELCRQELQPVSST